MQKVWWRNYCLTLFCTVFCFYYMLCWRPSKYIETKLQNTSFASYKAFLKNKISSETNLPASFSAWFLKQNISLVIFYWLIKFYYLVAFISWDIAKYVYCNCLLISCDVINFQINLFPLLKPFFLHDKKSEDKNLNNI